MRGEPLAAARAVYCNIAQPREVIFLNYLRMLCARWIEFAEFAEYPYTHERDVFSEFSEATTRAICLLHTL